MAGHSKWANIKHRKGAQDKKRAKQFTRAIKEITVAVKDGGGPDPETNPTLRNAIANAKGVNMPKDTIQRAIKKASGADAENYETVTFEGYGPHGIAIFVECTTDNTNRTVASVRSIFTKGGGSLGTNGSLEFLFDRKGVFLLEKEKLEMDIEALELELIEAGATEVEDNDDILVIYTDYNATTQTQRLIYAVSVADDMHLSDVMILDYAATGNLNSITNAAQGTWLAGKGWRFYDGVVYQFESASLRRIEYKRQAINLVQPEATQPQNRPIYSLSSQDLYQRLKTQPDNKQDYVEFHLKLALPITCLLFSILGALTGIQINRKTAANPLGNAVMLLVLYYSLISVGMSVAIAGLLPPIFAGWGPTGAIGVCVVILFYRQYRL